MTNALNVRGPLDLTVSGNTVWVASKLDDAVVRLDAQTGKTIGEPIAVGRNPFAIVAHGDHVWVTNLASATVSRIDIGLTGSTDMPGWHHQAVVSAAWRAVLWWPWSFSASAAMKIGVLVKPNVSNAIYRAVSAHARAR